MKGWEAIKAMEEGKCVRLLGRAPTYRKLPDADVEMWQDSSSSGYWKTHEQGGWRSLNDEGWEIVPDPSQPQGERTCLWCSKVLGAEPQYYVCGKCALPQGPEPYTVDNLPDAVREATADIFQVSRPLQVHRGIAAAILNECRKIAREEVERAKEDRE